MKEPKDAPLHWSQHKEHAAGYAQLKFLIILFRCFPVIILRIIAFPVGFFYFLFSKSGRTASRRFLQKISPMVEEPKLAKKCLSFFGPLRHIISFALALVERIQSWGGKYCLEDVHSYDDDIVELKRGLENGQGAFLIFSHLGNAELLRGLLNKDQTGVSRKIPVTAIIDMKVSAHFSRMLKELNPQSSMDVIGADEIDPNSAVLIEDRIAAGGLVLVTGDRTSIGGKNLMIPFLGKDAPFPSGVFYLAALINAPIYFVFGLRRKALSLKPEYNMYVHKNNLSFDCPRKEKLKRSVLLADSFVELLERYCKKQPYQWYNFFDFWQDGT